MRPAGRCKPRYKHNNKHCRVKASEQASLEVEDLAELQVMALVDSSGEAPKKGSLEALELVLQTARRNGPVALVHWAAGPMADGTALV